MDSLILKYRPRDWSDVIGQDHVVSSLKSVVAKRRNHAFLLVGPSGCGKTTLSRIIASKLGCTKNNLVEIDAATTSGIDAMREVTAGVQFSGLGSSPTRVVIVDEFHAASKSAIQALLKPIEEPPKDVFWCLCTTEVLKVPKTIVTRCAAYTLKSVSSNDIYELLVKVRDAENLQTPDDVLQLLSRKSDGSPRQALSNLAKCAKCQDKRQAAELIQVAGEESDVRTLCQALLKGGLTWEKAMQICESLKEENAESIRYAIQGYMAKVAMTTKDPDRVGYVLNILSAFSEPYLGGGSFSNVLLSLGRIILSD